ncbi:MAG TPA: MBL fold metallo-hydrolase [Candidatus Krumholzibacteria bacterium]|nr:MBL fold metallo-hydrolase [Candidatus Krumholzibacteria bacterium]
MIFHQIDAGGDRNFAYLIADEKGGTAAIFDPPPDPNRYRAIIEQEKVTVLYVVITHGHNDHCWGMNPARQAFGAKAVGHSSMHLDLDVKVDDGDMLPLGNLVLTFLYTPGHTDDHVCVVCKNHVITGDVLFVGKVGGTDLGPGARKEWESLKKLMQLPDDTNVWPGHNYGVAPTSTIGHEKKTNPFLLQPSFDAFIDLKANWLDYKKKHGIK